MTPYYQDSAVTIYHGDCRWALSDVSFDTLITDPVWPNATAVLFGYEDPPKMFREMWDALPNLPIRAAVHVGCDSDPRFLSAVPSSLPFFRVAVLEYAQPGFKGRLLMTGDAAYLFGEPPRSEKGKHLIPGPLHGVNGQGERVSASVPAKAQACRVARKLVERTGRYRVRPLLWVGNDATRV